jgi:hypothetical protein
MSELRVAVLGDSAVWGQGLATDDKFAMIAAREIAERLGRDPVIESFVARSGAKIRAAEKDGSVRIALPSGVGISEAPGDRVAFYDTFPSLFTTDDETRAFFAGTNEEMARALAGEIPATFPTVTYQVRRTPDAVGREIDLVIVDGSINDVEIDEVLDPDGDDLEDLARTIRRFAFDALMDLLEAVRAKFPRAVIVVTGYFSPFSSDSDRDQLESLAKFLSGRPGWQLALNDVLTSPYGRILLFPFSLLGTDVGQAVEKVIRRSEFAHRRGLFWMRKAVADLNETATAGAGLIFAHPGFRPDNSAFASGAPLVHEAYKPPGAGDHEVHDAALDERLRAIPRRDHLSALRTARTGLRALFSGAVNVAVEEILERLADLRRELDGPTSLRALLEAVVTAPGGLRPNRAREALPGVEAEIGRIEVSTIASFVHPNEAGARRYADVIVDRHTRQVHRTVRRDLERLAVGTVSVRDSIGRYGFTVGIGLRAFLHHMLVDTLAVEMKARLLAPQFPGSDFPEQLVPVFLAVGGDRRFRLDDPFGGLSVVDALGRLHLGDVRGLALEIGSDLSLVKIEVEDFRFLINGRTVFRSDGRRVLEGGRALSFPYPA